MKRYDGINYEANVDCFAKTVDITTKLLYGDVDYIKNPLFTVFIPTYDRVDLLKDAINSVINQWHVFFPWDIIVVDNEAYDGKPNKTEKLIREIDNPRILYYRNSEHMRPGDNFNRGILLARGKWVMMLHDDDILIANSLQNMGRVVGFLERHSKKPLGAVSVWYHQFKYDIDNKDAHWPEIIGAQNYYLSLPTNFWLYRFTHSHIWFTCHVGGDIPSNGATYNRAAVLDAGGFNDDYGISADLVLYYCLENKYDVYSTTVPYGFYRWGNNTMSKPESTYNVIKAGFDFREYVYSKNIFTKMLGVLLRASQHRRFTINVIEQKKRSIDVHLKTTDFDSICNKKPNMHWYAFYLLVISHAYEFVKAKQMKRLYKKSLKDKEIWE